MPSHDDRMAVRQALLRVSTEKGRRWKRFSDPIETHTAWALDEVAPLVEVVERAGQAGMWAVGFISYDAAPAFDSALVSRRNPEVPLAAFGLFEEVHDASWPRGDPYAVGPRTASCSEEEHRARVEEILELIEVGETYQVNLTFRLTASFSGDPMGLAAALIRAQPSDHAAFLDLGEAAVCSASPELFLRRIGSSVETWPMKGTRPRHPDAVLDQSLIADLSRSEKDRAENTMIVDMARNDLSRVARVGTVAVPRMHHIETYPTVHQMISVVTAETDASLTELLAATFPAASITGAPKVATSRIIASVEDTARGIYTGAIGHVAPGGSVDLSVAIRTAWIDRRRGTVEYGVGGGIVWDSTPDAEWAEAMHKAHILTRASHDFRLFETIAWKPESGAELEDRHVERLRRSAAHFGFEIDVGAVRRLIGSVSGSTALRLRLLLASDGTLELERSGLSPSNDGVAICAFDTRAVDSADEFLAHKTTRRDRYDEARSSRPGVFDVVLWNERGEVTESTIANLVAEIDGVLITPSASSGLLPGTLRGELLAAGTIREAIVSISDLEQATRLWLINSIRGWMPVEMDWTTAPVARTTSPPS